MLRINNISKSFDEKVIFEDLSLSFEAGSKTLINGQSGIGKTTLLRIIAGLETADGGGIDTEGKSISYMFQEPRLFMWLSVHDNLAAVMDHPDEEEITSILEKLSLIDEMDSMPAELSGGMQRRVSIARTLLFPAEIYLFDEPFAGLDPENAKTAYDVICEYTKNKTVIFVSHDTSMFDSIDEIGIK